MMRLANDRQTRGALRCRARGVVRMVRSGFTLIEMIIVIALLGIAGMLVIPAMGSVGALRSQAAVRTIVADLTFAQSDAIAFQQVRAVVFDLNAQTYSVVQVIGRDADATTSTLYDPSRPDGRYIVRLNEDRFAGVRVTSVAFNGDDSNHTLVLDDMGTPVSEIGSNEPGTGGVIRVEAGPADNPTQIFDIIVEPFTGRVSIRKIKDE